MSIHDHILVWDLETVPDLKAFAASNDLTGRSDDEIREALGDKFPKHVFHSIICIGALVAHRETGWKVDALGAPHVGERTEGQLITAFVERVRDLEPRLIAFNSHSFDLPVLRYRAMANTVAAPGLSRHSYFARYSEDAIDLCDVLSSYTPNARATLDEISRTLGLPGKPGMHGADVERYFREGRIKEIADYCEVDVVNTYRMWLRFELFRGRLSETDFNASEANLIEFIKARPEAKAHLQHFA